MVQTLYDIWISLFGNYQPVMTDVLDNTGTVIGQVVANGVAGVDWVYIALLVAFIVLLHGALRIIEAVLRSV